MDAFSFIHNSQSPTPSNRMQCHAAAPGTVHRHGEPRDAAHSAEELGCAAPGAMNAEHDGAEVLISSLTSSPGSSADVLWDGVVEPIVGLEHALSGIVPTPHCIAHKPDR